MHVDKGQPFEHYIIHYLQTRTQVDKELPMKVCLVDSIYSKYNIDAIDICVDCACISSQRNAQSGRSVEHHGSHV